MPNLIDIHSTDLSQLEFYRAASLSQSDNATNKTFMEIEFFKREFCHAKLLHVYYLCKNFLKIYEMTRVIIKF